MPDKTISLWLQIWDSLPEPIRGAVIAFFIALLRVFYDGQEPRIVRRVLEACLCGAIAYGVGSGAEALGLKPGMATFAGGAIGLFGADWVRNQAQAFARRKIEKERDR